MNKTEKCPECGAVGTIVTRARPRTMSHRGVAVELPATLELTECSACDESWVDNDEGDVLVAALLTAYNKELRRRALDSLATLEEFITQQDLEKVLHLSHGYISKLRSGAKDPSATLVGQLALLAISPKRRIAELQGFWASAAP